MRPIGVGVIGLGFIGARHVRAFAAADAAGLANTLVAVCDADPARRAGLETGEGNLGPSARGAPLFDARAVAGHERAEALIADPGVDLVCICTWTDSHVPLALAALEAGKHVLVEKPVALRPDEAARLAAAAAARPAQVCMPALCMRFWPGWDWLAQAVRDGRHGAVRAATFRRLSPAPRWGRTFYDDEARSGGALFDLHVHDADFVRACFGGTRLAAATGSVRHVLAEYRCERVAGRVLAEGGWLDAPDAEFSMSYTVEFDELVAHWSFGSEPRLTLRRPGATEVVPLAPLTGYDGEVRALLGALHGRPPAPGAPDPRAMIGEMVGLTELLCAEREALAAGAAPPR